MWPSFTQERDSRRCLVRLLHRRVVRCETTSPARVVRLAPEGRRRHGSYARKHSCARDFALGGNAARLLRHGLIAEASRPWLACGGYTRSLFPSILDPVSCPLPLVVRARRDVRHPPAVLVAWMSSCCAWIEQRDWEMSLRKV